MNGFRMRQLRQAAGLRQIEVAAELHLSNETICRWEKSDKDIPWVYEQAFDTLVKDVEKLHWIKSNRHQSQRERRFKK